MQRATFDRAFRAHVLTRPREAIAAAFGIDLPANFKLKFIEKDPDVDVMVVLPDLVVEGRAARTPRARRRIVPIMLMLIALSRAADAQAPQATLLLDDAVRTALANSPDIQIARKTQDINAGGVRVAQAPFDAVFKASMINGMDRAISPVPGNGVALKSDDTGTVGSDLSLGKYFRSGMALSGDLTLGRAALSSFPGPPIDKSSASVNLLLPIMKGRNGSTLTGTERQAVSTYDASVLSRRFSSAKVALATVLAYWDYLAASRQLVVFRGSEDRAETLVKETTVLVSVDERPPSDLNLLKANLATKRASRLDAEQRVVQTQYALGLAMGLPIEAIAALAQAGTDFPPSDRVDLPPNLPSTQFEATAMASRLDLAAAVKRQDGARHLVQGAQRDLLPQVDLMVGAGYAGIARGGSVDRYLAPIFRNVAGLNTIFQIQYQPAMANSIARGTVLQAEAAYQQAQIASNDLARVIKSNTAVATEALVRSRLAIEHNDEAVRLSRVVVEIEKKKFQLGISTLFDALLSEDTLTNALLAQINGQVRFAGAIARLRFETGTLVGAKGDDTVVDADAMMSISLAETIRR